MSRLQYQGSVDMFPYIFVDGFPVFQGPKTKLVSKPLDCCLKSCEFCPNFYHSFSIDSFGRVSPKIVLVFF